MQRFMMFFCFGVSSPPSKAIGTVSWHLRAIDQLWEQRQQLENSPVGTFPKIKIHFEPAANAAMHNYATSYEITICICM